MRVSLPLEAIGRSLMLLAALSYIESLGFSDGGWMQNGLQVTYEEFLEVTFFVKGAVGH